MLKILFTLFHQGEKMKTRNIERRFGARIRVAAGLAVVLFVFAAFPSSGGLGVGSAQAEESTTQSKALAVGASCFYLPAKAFYAVFGAATAGLAYGFTFGDDELANQIWQSSVEGSYVVTPAMIDGKEPVRFKGP
jgi:hypothetical protein